MAVAVVIGAIFLAGMVAAAGYALRTLPASARVPLNAGVPEHSVWLSRRAGLAAWLGIGAVAFAAVASVTTSSAAAHWSPSFRVVLLPAVMLVMLAAESGAVITARKALEPARPAAVAAAHADASTPGAADAEPGR